MNIHEIDWRVEPLHDVIVGIEAGLAAIRQRLEEEDGDGITALEHAEPLLGLGFVAAQAYVLGTWTDLNRIRDSSAKAPVSKTDCYATDSITVQAGIARVHVINATANYFKHHDEWTEWPRNETARILAAVGITKDTEFPCIHATELLCGPAWIDRATSNREGVERARNSHFTMNSTVASHLTIRCSRCLAGLFPSPPMIRILPEIASPRSR